LSSRISLSPLTTYRPFGQRSPAPIHTLACLDKFSPAQCRVEATSHLTGLHEKVDAGPVPHLIEPTKEVRSWLDLFANIESANLLARRQPECPWWTT
jgi:hypothetical protein